MAFRTQKISQMTPKGANLEATDLIEVSTIESGSYVTRSITGQELIDAIPAPTGFVPTSRTLTINGVAQDLSADRSWTISTGLTVGTTPISSGTIGRVLFQGTGNVLQQSSSLFWDSTNNRLGIGTSTPAVSLALTYSDNTFLEGASINNTNTGTQALSGVSFTTNGVLGGFMAYTPSNYISVAQRSTMQFTSTGNNKLAFIANSNSVGGLAQDIFFSTLGSNTTYQMQIKGNGNVQIGTNTDAGFRLDVNGTARIVGNTLLDSGIIATSASTTRLQGSTNYFTHNRIASSGVFGFQISSYGTLASFWRWSDATYDTEIGGAGAPLSGGLKFFTAGTEKTRITAGGNVLINTTTDAGFRLDVNGTARVQGSLTHTGLFFTSSVTGYWSIGNTGNNTSFGNFISNQGSSYYSILPFCINVASGAQSTSASVQIDSTTKGFLPPRMTTTQKNAIASPATGLQVFDTTLNQMSYYNGTTWTNI